MMEFLFLQYGFNMWEWPWHEWFPKKTKLKGYQKKGIKKQQQKCPLDCGTCKHYHISDCTRNIGCNACNPKGIDFNN